MELPSNSRLDCLSSNSYETALCVIPTVSQCHNIDRLRELYDKAYGIWPPHINLIYPFVAPENLARAQQQIKQCLDRELGSHHDTAVELSKAGFFKHRNNSTIFLGENQDNSFSFLEKLRQLAMQSVDLKPSPASLHLTIGQSESETLLSREFLLAKARLIPTIKFEIDALAILIRERSSLTETSVSMRLWGTIELKSADPRRPKLTEHWIRQIPLAFHESIAQPDECSGNAYVKKKDHGCDTQTGSTYCYSNASDTWVITEKAEFKFTDSSELSIASYNVLVEAEYSSERSRDPLLVENILSSSAMANILVLQEVSDEFLSYLLRNKKIQRRYMFTSHGPPDQPDIGPLPSMRNIVILSSWPFSWKFLPFRRRHKGALIAHFKGISTFGQTDIAVAGVHLSCGLTDGSVAAKHNQLKQLTHYLAQNHDPDNWIIAGDFNITTSTCTIHSALKSGSITEQTAVLLSSLNTTLNEIGLKDTYCISRFEAMRNGTKTDFHGRWEGETGATFDPRNNYLAAITSNTSENKPQRYDRILFRSLDTWRATGFNLFGLPEYKNRTQVVASDHYGVRTTLRINECLETKDFYNYATKSDSRFNYKQAVMGLYDLAALESTLYNHRMFPTKEQVEARRRAYDLLRKVILDDFDDQNSLSPVVSLHMVAIGSYALDIWTPESDLDCLCIGSISSNTFFKLARQRITRFQGEGIRILRKVEAKSGTMLELSVNGIAADLQYCPAARISERWSEFQDLPAQDSIFDISLLSLRKLKPYRELLYLQRTIPSLPVFRLAYRCIKLWAIQRGIYSSKFGYLSGIHIQLMLACICKKIWYHVGPVEPQDVMASFFNHYANFDWANEVVFDAFFHKGTPRYHRSAREPMVILGYYAPNSNIAHTSTFPGLQILIKEFKKAAEDLSCSTLTWIKFFRRPDGIVKGKCLDESENFRSAYQIYVKFEVQYWGRTFSKGKSVVGWIESRCLSLVVDINKALPDLELRIWPARFTHSGANLNDADDYHGCYLIGISGLNSTPGDGKIGSPIMQQRLETALDNLLTQMRTDERNYDPSTSWIDISIVRAVEVQTLQLDNREWGDSVAETELDSDDEEEPEQNSEDFDEKPVQRMIPQRPKPTPAPLSKAKLRPASDVLNRLRWDTNLDPNDYIVGYEDRFLGAREMSLVKWKTEQTDEEFIPQHRILYFKKKSGEYGECELVWERLTRLDRIFGSGANASEVIDDL